MAGLLDYYKENPELWAENEYLLKKDPAYDLGMMDLDIMGFGKRLGGKYRPEYGPVGKKLYDWFGWGDEPEYEPRSRIQGAYLHPDSGMSRRFEKMELEPGKIGLYTGPFTEGDAPTYWTDPNLVPPDERTSEPLFNLDKARIMAHENRHRLMYEYPELYETQPTWSGMEEGMSFAPGSFKKMGNEYWRNEAFNRFQDLQNFPESRFRGDPRAAEWYPTGLSAVDLRPQDMYFDKIWREHWKPYAKRFNKKLKEISKRERRNVPGTPIVPMGRGRGRDRPDRGGADLSPGGGYGQSPTGSDIAGTPFSRGGILGAF